MKTIIIFLWSLVIFNWLDCFQGVWGSCFGFFCLCFLLLDENDGNSLATVFIVSLQLATSQSRPMQSVIGNENNSARFQHCEYGHIYCTVFKFDYLEIIYFFPISNLCCTIRIIFPVDLFNYRPLKNLCIVHYIVQRIKQASVYTARPITKQDVYIHTGNSQ